MLNSGRQTKRVVEKQMDLQGRIFSSLKVFFFFFCDETLSSQKVLLVMLLVTKLRFVTKGMTSSTFSDETVLSQKK